MKIKVENETNKTYQVNIQYGPADGRMDANLGTITTNNNGTGNASFDLSDLGTPLIIIMPGFVLFKQNPFPDPEYIIAFQTSIFIPPPTSP